MTKKEADGPGYSPDLKQRPIFRIASWYATATYVLIIVANVLFTVWRPLYTEPAFTAVLAAHGQKLVYAK